MSRRTVKLSKSLHRDLSLYALAAGASGVGVLSLAPPAAAQIVYTPADQIMERNGKIFIDLNHDGVTDVLIREVACHYRSFPGNALQALTKTGGGIEGSNPFASVLVRGAKIGRADLFVSNTVLMFSEINSGPYYGGSWGFVKDQYLGIRFEINQDVHYGWARLNTKSSWGGSGITAQLTGYAYETEPGKSIRAGDTGQREEGGAQSQKMSPSEPTTKRRLTLAALALGAAPPSYCQ